jgi:hypothetical protein
MNKLKNNTAIVLLLASVFLLNACGTITKNTFSPQKVELRANVKDMRLLGETEVSVSYRTYLGLFSTIDQVNGVDYDSDNPTITKLNNSFFQDRKLEKATYKAIDEFPEADYYQIAYKKIEVVRLFLGSEVKVTARIRAYSFR